MEYRYIATSEKGFVRQLACNYLAHGYWYYVTGRVKPGRVPEKVDQAILDKYGVRMSRNQRWKRKRRGLGNVHYLRYEDFWVLVCTKGEHLFFREHEIRDKRGLLIKRFYHDVRKKPIIFRGYSTSVKRGKYKPYRHKSYPDGPREKEEPGKYRVKVQISRKAYGLLTAEFLELAARRYVGAKVLEQQLRWLRYEPYAPVRQQLLELVRRMNKVRGQRGFRDKVVAKRAVRMRIDPVSPFEPVSDDGLEAA